MKNPTCSQCSKVIPDGFTDCPWCGATRQAALAPTPPLPTIEAQPAAPHRAPGSLLTWIGFLLSFAVFGVLEYLDWQRTATEVSLASSAYFLGQSAGRFIVAAILVFVFDRVRARNPSAPARLLAISTVAVAMTFLSLLYSASSSFHNSPRRALREVAQSIKNPAQPHLDKWAVAVRPFFVELVSRNQDYVEEVSRLDNALLPLYSPASFRDAASIQPILDALGQRLAIADKNADIQPLLAKMPGYIASVDAPESEKQKFLDDFNKFFAKGLASKNSVFAQERAWILSAIDLYQFALAHRNSYTNSGQALFKNSADAATFNGKLNNSRQLYAQFLHSYQASRNVQDALLAQMGLERSDIAGGGPH